MPAFICTACGTQFSPSDAPPAQCPVCEDERQYIPPEGQSWTTLERLRISHHNGFRQYEPGLIGIGTQPKFAIGQRALLLCTSEGNILWDCISLIDDATITAEVKVTLLSHRSTSAVNTHVETDKGVVTLTGKADNSAEKDLVTKLVEDIDGVKSVDNNMTY